MSKSTWKRDHLIRRNDHDLATLDLLDCVLKSHAIKPQPYLPCQVEHLGGLNWPFVQRPYLKHEWHWQARYKPFSKSPLFPNIMFVR